MPHPFCELRIRTIVGLAVLVAIPALPGTATAQDAAAAPSLSPRLLVDASWHGRPIRRPLPTRSDVADRAPALRAGTGFRRPGGSQRVRDLQRRLSRLGYRPGASDGLFGPRTQAAVLAFQRKHGLERTGAVSPATLRVLRRRTAVGAAPEAVQPASSSPVRSAHARPAPAAQVTRPHRRIRPTARRSCACSSHWRSRCRCCWSSAGARGAGCRPPRRLRRLR